MKYGITAIFIKVAFSKTAFHYIEKQAPDLDIKEFRRKVFSEYREMVKRAPEVGSLRKNAFVTALYAACFFLAMYKIGKEFMSDALIEGLIREVPIAGQCEWRKRGRAPLAKRKFEAA